ncbi:MAG: hypothetical protein NTZ26_11145 [Candidatus Aminicenantes bacterium]|nr:hypothetical protein [Candidatus Aminicenantes bacterium]
MKTRSLFRFSGVLCAALACASLGAAQMTVKDVISLKKLGFSDTEILAEAAKSGPKLALTEADVAQLKAAGASDALIKGLGNPPRDIALEDVIRMVKAGQPTARIIDAIAGAAGKPPLGAMEALNLQRQKIPAAVIFALRGRPLGVAEVRALAEEKADPPVFEQLGKMLGFVQTALSVEEAMELMRIGVPADSVKALKTAAAPKLQPNPEPPLPEPPAPSEELAGTWEGTMKSAGMTVRAVMTFDRNGDYSLNVSGYLQQGKWSVVHNNLVLAPNDGMEEAERYELKNETLLIKGANALLTLRRKQ